MGPGEMYTGEREYTNTTIEWPYMYCQKRNEKDIFFIVLFLLFGEHI